MDIGSILFILGLFVLVALYISRPFFERKATAVTQQETEYSTLLAEYDRILVTLQDLDFNHDLGKIPADEYPTWRQQWMQRGAEVLRQLDEIEGQTGQKHLDSRLEAAIQARRTQTGQMRSIPSATGDDDLEALIASRRRQRQEGGQEKSSSFCTQCGAAVRASDRFCPKCGASLS